MTTVRMCSARPLSPDMISGTGGHRYFEPNRPLLSLSPPTTAPGPRRLRRSVLTHAILSYLFGVVIVAGSVNLISGLVR